MYEIILGRQGATDCQLGIIDTKNNNKVFFDMESFNWKLLGLWWCVLTQSMVKRAHDDDYQEILGELLSGNISLRNQEIDPDYDVDSDTDDSYEQYYGTY